MEELHYCCDCRVWNLVEPVLVSFASNSSGTSSAHFSVSFGFLLSGFGGGLSIGPPSNFLGDLFCSPAAKGVSRCFAARHIRNGIASKVLMCVPSVAFPSSCCWLRFRTVIPANSFCICCVVRFGGFSQTALLCSVTRGFLLQQPIGCSSEFVVIVHIPRQRLMRHRPVSTSVLLVALQAPAR